MSIENKLDKEFEKLKNELKQNFNQPCNVQQKSSSKPTKKVVSNSELLNNMNDNQICLVGNTVIPCKINENIDQFHQDVNKSKSILRIIPEQKKDNNYENIFVNKTFDDNKSCKVRGTNQHIFLDKDQKIAKIRKDSDGYCIFPGTNIG